MDKEKISKKSIKFVKKQITNFTDQDAINKFVKGKFLQVSKKWNINSKTPEKDNVKILHFLGGEKPWWYGSTMKIAPKYFELIDRTPFAGWRPKSPIEQKEIIII